MDYLKKFDNIEVRIGLEKAVNYVCLHNGDRVCGSLSVKNTGPRAVRNIFVTVEGYYFPAVEYTIESLGAKESVELDPELIKPSIDRLMTLSEAVYTEIAVSVRSATRELAAFRLPISIQAWNHWGGIESDLSGIVSFVVPHHGYVSDIISKASVKMTELFDGGAICGYESSSPDSLKQQLASVWEALRDEKIKYLIPSAEYFHGGQKIITPDMIRRYGQGNCLDLSLLLCSCFERMALSPVMVFMPGHVVAGVWTTPVSGDPDAICDNQEYIEECIFGGKAPGLILFESTSLHEGLSMAEACALAEKTLRESRPQMMIDISAARKAGIQPLPFNGLPANDVRPGRMEIEGCNGARVSDSVRLDGWERRLLDLTLRNPMLNLHPGKNILPIREKDVQEIVNHLKANRLGDLVDEKDKDPTDLLKNLYRTSRTHLEENGANALFVAVGTIRWFDVDDSTPHLAPILFIPVTIVRKKAMTYEIRMRDDDPMVNVTLVEMMRRMFGVTFPELDSLPLDSDEFPDWRRIIGIFGEHVVEINKRQPDDRKWELPVESYVGIFSFKKYLMWHDIHTHPAMMASHPVVSGFINGCYSEVTVHPDARQIESESHSGLMLPIDYDSSQLEAVAECHAGNSFVLHGPPGTGKSQTITNMIADAVYSGKRVLFVAEKKAALEVVRNRLNSLGLMSYCLELHSNKTDKRSFFGQLNDTNIGILASGYESERVADGNDVTEIVQRFRNLIDGITEAIHSVRSNNLSLYDCMENFITDRYAGLTFDYDEICNLKPEEIRMLCSELASLDLVEQILGYHPSQAELSGLYPVENTVENQRQLTETLSGMPLSIAKARRKATGWINRWFSKRTPEEILHSDPLWIKLMELSVIPKSDVADIDSIERNITRWNAAINQLRKWYHFSEKAHAISRYSLPSVMDYYLQSNSGEETARMTESGFYHSLADHVIDTDSHLRSFNGKLHRQTVVQYLGAVDSMMERRRQSLRQKLERRLRTESLSPAEQKQLTLLSRRILSNGRGVALRKVINESETVLQKLFPCMLMSPLSVAQYLEMKPGMFDVVIFDEASQMETPDAVGTIARGRSVVVVGDPMQLPPTRFFTAGAMTGEEPEEVEDADSILDECIALGLPSRYLSRHYRSRHESLIAFSNMNFYNNRLLTFPSCNDSERKVTHIDPHGVYDCGKSRTNRIEAEAVVKHLVSLIEQGDEAPSIGVVAFSKSQGNLIEDLFNTRIARSKVLQAKLEAALWA